MAMKTLALVSFFGLFALFSERAEAQIDPGPPPPINAKAKPKSKEVIPPAPPIARLRHRAKASSASAMASHRTPGHDTSGRTDMSAKPVPFYPVARAANQSDLKKQASAIRSSKRAAANKPPGSK
jgi:hypothetical protein